MTYQGKIAWVTGASSGIGAALAAALSSKGASVILSGRRVDALAKLRASLPGEALLLPFEATEFADLPAVAERAIGWRGRVDLLINNAGITQRSLALDTEFEVYRRLMEVDFFGPLRLTQLVLPHMVARKGGHISVVSSMAGKIGNPLRTGYCAAKHAVGGYFEALRSEVDVYDIGVSIALPGPVATSVALSALKGDGSPHNQADPLIDEGMPARECAEVILEGIAAGMPEIPVGRAREIEYLRMRTEEPDSLFALVAEIGARLAGEREP